MDNAWKMKCPQCEGTTELYLLTLQEVHATPDGFTLVGQAHVGLTTPARCKGCGYVGLYPDFAEKKDGQGRNDSATTA